MSLLDKIQAKTERQEALSSEDESILMQQDKPIKKDLLASFREIRRTEPTPKEQPLQMTKHQELKNRLHKQILNELKDEDVEAIIPKIDAMAVEIIKEDESFRGKIDRKKVVEEL